MQSLLNKFDDEYVIKEEDVLEIVSFYLKSNNLNVFLNDIVFNNESSYLAYYNLSNNTILLNNQKIWDFCYKKTDKINMDYYVSDKYYTYFLNFYYISVLFHELSHAIQKKKFDDSKENDSLYVYLYDLCRLLEYSDMAFYNANHDLLPMEIEATNNGLFKAYQLMTYTKLPKRECQIMHLEYLSSLLSNYIRLNNYKVLSPLDKLHVKNNIIDIEEIYHLMNKENLTKMERLNLGLDITVREYDALNKEKRKILFR